MTNSILAAFEANLSAFFNTVKSDVEKFFAKAVPVLEQDAEIAFEDLAAIAGKAVIAEAQFAISNPEKFGNAVQHVVQTVEAQGKTVLLQSAQAAVQVAVLSAQQVASGQ